LDNIISDLYEVIIIRLFKFKYVNYPDNLSLPSQILILIYVYNYMNKYMYINTYICKEDISSQSFIDYTFDKEYRYICRVNLCIKLPNVLKVSPLFSKYREISFSLFIRSRSSVPHMRRYSFSE